MTADFLCGSTNAHASSTCVRTCSWCAFIRTDPRMKLLHFLLVVELIASLPCEARDYTFTVIVEAGKSDCFYDYIHKGAFLEIEYQVDTL